MRLDGLRAIDPAKIENYLLNLGHARGADKARFFCGFGFSPANPGQLEMALLRHPLENDVASTTQTRFGAKSVIECQLRTPDGRDPCIVTVWIKETGSAAHRFVTAYPGG